MYPSEQGKSSCKFVYKITCTTARHTLVTQTFCLSCKKISFLMCEFFTYMYYEATRILLYLKPTVVNYPRYPRVVKVVIVELGHFDL